jgi:uncharacterized protein YegL
MATGFFEPDEQPAKPRETARRVALVVGNGNYRTSRLSNPPQDAALIGRALDTLGFDTEVLIDADKPALETAIVRLGERIERAGPQSIGFFYFAGHGIQHQGVNYMVPVGTKIPDIRYLKSGAVAVEYLVEEFGGRPTQAAVIVLDACRDNRVSGSGGGLTRGLAAIQGLPNGTIVAFATAAGQVADDGSGGHSPYASALSARLVEPNRRLDEVFFLVAQDVALATGNAQQPALFVQGAVPPILLRNEPAGPTAVAAALPSRPEPAPASRTAISPAEAEAEQAGPDRTVTAAPFAQTAGTETESNAPKPAFGLEAVGRRQLNVFFLVDCSGSMSGAKINSLNMAMRMAVPEMRKAALGNPLVDVVVRVLRFSDGAAWHVEGPVPVGEFEWSDLVAGGDTDMGHALALAASVMPTLSAAARQFPPVVVLMSDGQPSDDFEHGLRELLATRAGAKAVRVAIAIGSDADRDVLRQFIHDGRFEPLEAHNVTQLVERIRWVSSALLSQHSLGLPRRDPEPQATQPADQPASVDWVW